jgi:hypothetical protein
MMKQFIQLFKVSSFPVLALASALTLTPSAGAAWTSARLTDVEVTVDLVEQGPSKVKTSARFAVSGGRFHGFDLSELPGGRLIEEESSAVLDDGRIYPLSFRQLRGGITRVVLASGVEVDRGGVNFSFVHEIDFVEQGALRWYEGRARFNWTPLIWDESLDVMKIEIALPGNSMDSLVSVDPAVTSNYEVSISDDRVDLIKFRPVRWYPMQVIVDFDPTLVPTLKPAPVEKQKNTRTDLAATASYSTPSIPRHIATVPYVIAIIGFIALFVKAFHVRRVYANTGIEARFSLLSATSLRLRTLLTLGALALGLQAQHAGSLAAGVPAFAIAATLWMCRREQCLGDRWTIKK